MGDGGHETRDAEQRMCYRCSQLRSADAFVTQVADRHYGMCRACLAEVMLARGPGAIKRRLTHTDTERECYLCRRILPIDGFTRRRNGTFFSACKACNRNVFA